ncbi:CpXC domain-containing protein [Ruminococcus flavefaciens]|uniref:CpXC domain-containing protein n=1 Tax=Ruminococcus flavefaciens TaxID=1265 RepID=UPI0026E95908|nr:CpXC domain-containing protein [Ruminococcus flavefaciens]MDD7515371.1 CpXC domain-containing protein [Ruminococcus flavefaciens]MDY5690405.1 CpXC domain-containing protein [Ruminococcus flavefaciens]
MSKNHIEKIKCSKCNAESEMLVWETMDTSTDPQLKAQIRNGDCFGWHCPHCDNKSLIFYPTIYHQVNEHYIICYVPGNPSSAVEYMKNINENNQSGYDFNDNYTKRVVSDINQLREKLLILDEGLDDRIIEIMKVFAMAEIQKSFSDLTVAEIYFNKEQDGTYNLAVKFDNGQWGSTDFAMDSYDQVVKTFKTSLAVDDEVIIDTEWAISMIEKQM